MTFYETIIIEELCEDITVFFRSARESRTCIPSRDFFNNGKETLRSEWSSGPAFFLQTEV